MFIKSFSEITDDVLFPRHFTDLDYLDWFSTEEITLVFVNVKQLEHDS